MAYVRQRKAYKLIFEGDLEGLEVIANSAGTDDYLMMSELASIKMPLLGSDLSKFKKLLKAFAEVLVSWNLQNEPGKAVPATYEGLLSQDPEFVGRVISAWLDALVGAQMPAEVVDEGSLPMEALT